MDQGQHEELMAAASLTPRPYKILKMVTSLGTVDLLLALVSNEG